MNNKTSPNARIAPERGSKFGFLTVIRELTREERPKQDKRFFELQCDCGKTAINDLYSFTNKKLPITSCGCKTSELTSAHFEEKFQKLIGQKFNRLTILGTHSINKGLRQVDCQCDCGKRTHALLANITSGKSKSCGCYHKEITASKKVWEVEFKQWAHKAEVRKQSFNLNLEQFTTLCSQNCFYCGFPPAIKTAVGKKLRNGIDRQNNLVGYEPENCVSCCKICNRAKLTMPVSDLLAWIERIKNHTIPTSTLH